MQTITTALATVIWYGPTTTLSSASWRNSTSIVRLVNGAGYSSYDPTQGINSLSQVVAGQVLIVESPSVAYSGAGFTIDNGTAPTATANPVRLIASFPAGGTSPAPLTITLSDQVGTYNLDGSFPAAGVTGVTYTKAGAGVVALPITLALNDVLTISGTTVAGTAGILTLLKQ
jgi:hypothetical protein